MNNLLFSIYTAKGGHNIVSFDIFKDGEDAFAQATKYTQTTYNDPADKPKLFLLSEIPMNWDNVLRTPAEWEAIQKITILDPDGWRVGCDLGVKPITTPITEAEFNKRRDESTIYPLRVRAKVDDGRCPCGEDH